MTRSDSILHDAAGESSGTVVTETAGSPWQTRHDRDSHRSAKREAVLLAAARLFAERGYQGTSLDDIARRLRVSKPTLYHYVQNKDELLFACLQRGQQTLLDGLEAVVRQGANGRDGLRAALQRHAAEVTGDFGLCVARVAEDNLSEPRRPPVQALKRQTDAAWRGLIAQGMAQGLIDDGDADVVVRSVVGALGGLARWYRPGEHSPGSLRDATHHCIEMLLRGALAPPARTADASNGLGPGPAAQAIGDLPTVRVEAHFGDRVTRCYAQRPANLAQMLAQAVAACPDGEALVCDELRLSWRELHHAACKCAAGLAQRGVGPGDRVALHLGNAPEFVIVALACAWMGAVLVPVSSRAHAAELQFALEDAGAVAIVCAAASVPLLPTPPALPTLRHRFVVAAAVAAPNEPFMALMQSSDPAGPAAAHRAGEEELAVLLYTSGTTGTPKGAMLTHLNIAHSVLHFVHGMGLGDDERSIVAVPLSHVTGLVAQLYTMLQVRGCTVLMPQFKAADFVALAARERITHAVLVPAMYNLCLLLPDLQDHDLRHWRIGAYGGAAMPTASIDALARRLPGLTLINAYGATETSSPATLMPPGQTHAHRDSVGRPVACADIRVMDDAGHEVPSGSAGEIWIAGPMVVPGYWRNAAATQREFCGGYWRSGDIGSSDAEGYVRVFDRKKDVINRGGYKIFCVQVENALAEHPQVIESALVGVPCAVLGERVHAFVCVRAVDDSTTPAAMAAFCAARMSDYAVPETWRIGTEALPRNLNGKIMKRALRESLRGPGA